MYDSLVAELGAHVREDELRDAIFCRSNQPLSCRKADYIRLGQSKSTLDETDDFLEMKLGGRGCAVERDSHRAQAFRCDKSKPRHHWYSAPQPDGHGCAVHNLHTWETGARRRDEMILSGEEISPHVGQNLMAAEMRSD